MAKKKTAASRPSKRPVAEPTPEAKTSRMTVVLVAILAVLLALGGFVAWHRGHDPRRVEAREWEREHTAQIEQRMALCFGGADAAAIRRLLPAVRRGQYASPLRECAGSRLSDLENTPRAFITVMRDVPTASQSAHLRERVHLDRLYTVLHALNVVLAGIPRESTIPEASRDRVATSLDDVAAEVDNERSAFATLLTTVEGEASWW